MLRRFSREKPPDPFPPIEGELVCPQCGFDHNGWGFEPGYAKRCVKCGCVMEEGEPPPARGDGAGNGSTGGVLGRFFRRLLRTKGAPGDLRGEETGMSCPRQPAGPGVGQGPQGGQEGVPAGGRAGEPSPEFGPMAQGQSDTARIGTYKKDGRALASQGRYQEAAELLSKVVEFEPNDPECWGELGRIYYKGLGDLARSIECSQRALEIDEDLVWARSNLCLALLKAERFEEAREGFLAMIRAVRESRSRPEEFEENRKVLLEECLAELYGAKKAATGRLLTEIQGIIELIELEQFYFH